MIKERAPISLKLSLITFAVNGVLGVFLGIIAALKPGKVDFIATTWAVLGVATPGFWAAILLIMVFSVWLGWFPTSGWVDPLSDPVRAWRYLVLPVTALGVFGSAAVMRQTRSSLLEVLRQDYVRTARAKGLRESPGHHEARTEDLAASRHYRSCILLSYIFAGSVLIERIFAIPGLGRLAVDSTLARDIPIIQAIVLLSTLMIVFATMLADILYSVLNPRIRYD